MNTLFFFAAVSGLGSPPGVVNMYLWVQMQHFLGHSLGNGLFLNVIFL